MSRSTRGRGGVGARQVATALAVLGLLLLPAGGGAQPAAAEAAAEVEPGLAPVDTVELVKRLRNDLMRAKNQGNYSEVCQKLDMLRDLGQDLSASRQLAAYAYLVCARQHVNSGDIEGTERCLKLSIEAGGEKPEHDQVRAMIDSQRGLDALRRGELESALSTLQLAYARGLGPEDREEVSAALTQYAYEMHGRGEDVRALATLDAALAIFPRNRQAELLQREIFMWDYGVWIAIAFIVFGVAVYFVFRQWREVKLRDSLLRDW